MVVISKWELSGNGSGQRNEEDKDFGHIAHGQKWLGGGDNDCADGDNRKIFLRQHESHVLHYWQFFDDNDLLSHSLAKLSDETRANSRSVPVTCTSPTRTRNDDKKTDVEFKEKVSASFETLAKSQAIKELRQEKIERRKLSKALNECDDDDEKKELQSEIKDSDKIISDLKKSLEL